MRKTGVLHDKIGSFSIQPSAFPRKLGSFCVKKTDTFAGFDLRKIRFDSQLRPDCFLGKLGSFCKK